VEVEADVFATRLSTLDRCTVSDDGPDRVVVETEHVTV
jgi:hypothetical protein